MKMSYAIISLTPVFNDSCTVYYKFCLLILSYCSITVNSITEVIGLSFYHQHVVTISKLFKLFLYLIDFMAYDIYIHY